MDVKKVLWPTDFSKNAEQALPYVTSLGEKYQTDVHVLYVIEELALHEPWYGEFDQSHIDKIHEWEEKTAKKRLDEICKDHLNGCPLYKKHIAIGDPAQEILKLTEEEKVDMVVFRENTEDVYAGIEWPANSPEANQLVSYISEHLNREIRPESAIGIKPMSKFASQRLVRRAIRYALDQGYQNVTLVHKGNIMKYTEGAFRQWGYELAAEEFAGQTISEADVYEKHGGKQPPGRVVIKDRIADMMFQQALLRPDEYDVLAMPNLNGDYLSDALAAQVGGLGMAPGANIGDEVAVFEATHGTAPKYAGQDKVNPSSLILSGAMLFDYMGWKEVGDLIRTALEATVSAGTVTYDLARQMDEAEEVKCSEFASAIVERM